MYAFKLDDALAIPLTFFSATVLAGLIRSFSTRLDFDRAADAIEDRLNDRLGRR
jgi:hypothetical protein